MIELHAHSCYSFLDGASQPQELAQRAAELGHQALALTDHDSLSGSLEFAHAAHDAGLRPITGCELTLAGGAHLTLLVETQAGYRNLCRLLTLAHADDRRAPAVTLDQLGRPRRRPALPVRLRPRRPGRARGRRRPQPRGGGCRPPLRGIFGRDRFAIELQRPYWRGDARRNRLLAELAGELRLRTVATGDVARPQRPPRVPAGRAGGDPPATPRSMPASATAAATARRCCAPPAEMAARFPAAAVRGAIEVADRCRFDLDQRPRLQLSRLRLRDRRVGHPGACTASAATSWSAATPAAPTCTRHARRLDEELGLIDHHGLAGFFLLHRDILELAREVAVERARLERRPPAAAARAAAAAPASARSSAT